MGDRQNFTANWPIKFSLDSDGIWYVWDLLVWWTSYLFYLIESVFKSPTWFHSKITFNICLRSGERGWGGGGGGRIFSVFCQTYRWFKCVWTFTDKFLWNSGTDDRHHYTVQFSASLDDSDLHSQSEVFAFSYNSMFIFSQIPQSNWRKAYTLPQTVYLLKAYAAFISQDQYSRKRTLLRWFYKEYIQGRELYLGGFIKNTYIYLWNLVWAYAWALQFDSLNDCDLHLRSQGCKKARNCYKLHEANTMFAMFSYVREMAEGKSCKYGEYGSFEQLLFLLDW